MIYSKEVENKSGVIMKVKKLKRVILICIIFGVLINVNSNDVSAASQGWNLRYLKGAPTSEDITSWSGTVCTTKSTTSMTTNQVGGGAHVFLYTSNGIGTMASNGGVSTSVNTRIGINIYARVAYSYSGDYSNNPSGTFVY